MIQGTASDMTEIAMILMRRYIDMYSLRDKVRFFMQVHDQVDCAVHRDYAEEWAVIHKELMELAAEIVLGNQLLKADVEINEVWTK